MRMAQLVFCGSAPARDGLCPAKAQHRDLGRSHTSSALQHRDQGRYHNSVVMAAVVGAATAAMGWLLWERLKARWPGIDRGGRRPPRASSHKAVQQKHTGPGDTGACGCCGTEAGVYALLKTSSPPWASTTMLSPLAYCPERIFCASGFSSWAWIARLSGRAP